MQLCCSPMQVCRVKCCPTLASHFSSMMLLQQGLQEFDEVLKVKGHSTATERPAIRPSHCRCTGVEALKGTGSRNGEMGTCLALR